jgi:hypothetical protein
MMMKMTGSKLPPSSLRRKTCAFAAPALRVFSFLCRNLDEPAGARINRDVST